MNEFTNKNVSNASTQKQCAKINLTNTTIENQTSKSTENSMADKMSSGNNQNNKKTANNLQLVPVAVTQSKNSINIEQITEAMIPKAIDLIFRTDQRISQETQIVADLEVFLKEHKFNLKVMPFGSATYGFGGTNTDFNICLLTNDGNCLMFIL